MRERRGCGGCGGLVRRGRRRRGGLVRRRLGNGRSGLVRRSFLIEMSLVYRKARKRSIRQNNTFARFVQQRNRIGGGVHAVIRNTHNQRRIVARYHYRAWLVRAHNGKRIRADKLLACLVNSHNKLIDAGGSVVRRRAFAARITTIFAGRRGVAVSRVTFAAKLAPRFNARRFPLFVTQLNQVRNKLGIGLTNGCNAVLRQLIFQFAIIFNNPIMNKSNAAMRRHMRMRIFLARLAVRCPARMTNSAGPMQRKRRARILKLAYFAASLNDVKRAIVHQRNASRIVASIFKSAQTIQQIRACFFSSCICNNATHKLPFLVVFLL